MNSSPRPRRPRQTRPAPDPENTTALSIRRWLFGSPDDPLDFHIDYTLLERLGWRPGDRITFEPVALDRGTREGGLIIRRAAPGEPAIKLRKGHYRRKPNPHWKHFPDGPDGPDVEWPCPPEWVETFFPQEYLPGPGPAVFAPPSRRWMLYDLLDQRGQVAVSLDCSFLEFRLQRTDPAVPALDVHLPLGVLHLMGWSPSTPLALISETGFDPFAEADTLTIRRSHPGESDLTWDGDKFVAELSPAWLDRFFPGLHDNSEEAFPDEDDSWQDWPEERDTLRVPYCDFGLGPDSLSFAIPRADR